MSITADQTTDASVSLGSLIDTLGIEGIAVLLALASLCLLRYRGVRKLAAKALRHAARAAVRYVRTKLWASRLGVPIRLAYRLEPGRWREMTEQRSLAGLKRGRVRRTPAGIAVRVTLNKGLTLARLEASTAALETGLGLKRGSVSIEPVDSAHKAVVHIALRSVATESVPAPTWDLVPTDEEREILARLMPEHWAAATNGGSLAGTLTEIPRLTDAGIEVAVRLEDPWTTKKLRSAAEHVRALLGAPTDLPMLVGPGELGGWGVIRLRTRSAAPDGTIVWRPGDALGVDMIAGEDVHVPLGNRMLIAGMSGAGKSTASRPLLFEASEGPTNALVIIDLKRVEGRLWDHRARVAYTPEAVVELVAELVAEMNERLDGMPKGQATLKPTAQRPRITVVVDEGAEVMSSAKAALEGLDSIARMGRAPSIDLWWMTQSPTYGDGVPRQIAKQLSHRIGLAVESPSEARVVFGESAQEKGWKADELPMPGVAMVRDGKRSPDPVKVRYIDDEAVVALPDQTIWRRQTTVSSAPTLSLVKDAPEPQPELTVAEAVQKALAGGPLGAGQIISTTGRGKSQVYAALAALTESGVVAKNGKTYALAVAA